MMNTRFSTVSLLTLLALSLYVSAATFSAVEDQRHVDTQIPTRAIVMWSGNIEEIPNGWSLCDGTNGTPDLRNRFILGAATNEQVNVQGGSYNHSHREESHSHRINLPRARKNVMRIPSGYGGGFSSNRYTVHNLHYYTNSQKFNSSSAAPQAQAVQHLPPFYKLAFIMKN